MAQTTADTLYINTILGVALEKKATDVHLMSGNYPIFRLDNSLFVLADQRVMNVDTIASVADSFLSADEKQRLLTDKEVRTVFTWANRARFRLTVYYQQGYPAVSFRAIQTDIKKPTELGIPQSIIDRMQRRSGIILIGGPYNSGRTTTMMSLLQQVNIERSVRIVTLERPVEFVLVNSKSLINQREVGRDTPSFVKGISDASDDDVDIVAVSEITEAGLEERLIMLAESGKLVLAIVNANSSVFALEKFIEGVSSDNRQWAIDSLSGTLLAIVNQRLIPSVGGGRVLAAEVLTMTPAVATIIQDSKFAQLKTVMQTSREDGMVVMDIRLQELVRTGKISLDEARKFASEPSAIRSS